jgi:hypothetical protein
MATDHAVVSVVVLVVLVVLVSASCSSVLRARRAWPLHRASSIEHRASSFDQ